MTEQTHNILEFEGEAVLRASKLLKTLGNKDRLMVLCHLNSGEKTVGELTDLLRIAQPRLSQHLSRMRTESLVTTRREATTIYYSIASHEATHIVELMPYLFCKQPESRKNLPLRASPARLFGEVHP